MALPFQRDHFVCYSKANYTVTNKPSEGVFLGALGDRLYIDTDKPSPGTPLRVPRDRLHKWQTSLPLVPISDYTRGQTTDEFSSGAPLRVPGDRLPRQTSAPLEFVPKHLGTDYIRKTNWLTFLWGFLRIHMGAGHQSQIYRQPFPWYPPRNRLHKNIGAFLGTPFKKLPRDKPHKQ